jgi:hypothetical protein
MTTLNFSIRDEGSLVLFTPLDEAATEWWNENVEAGHIFGSSFVVESRYAQDIYNGICDAGSEITRN